MKLFKNIKIVEVSDRHLLGVKGYTFYKYSFEKKKWKFYAKVDDKIIPYLSKVSYLRRFFRAEITYFYTLSDGTQLCIGKKAIFRKEKEDLSFTSCFKVMRGSRPLNICIDESEHLYFGEYFQNPEREDVFIYCSTDRGKSWDVKYTFKAGDIRHIHAVQHDPFTNHIWVLTGDDDGECVIGYTEDKFKSFNVVFSGGQEYRACKLYFYKDFIVYATDSPLIENELRVFKRSSFETKQIEKLQGSVIKGGQIGELSFFSTTVERSKVNTCKESHLWVSQNGLEWKDIYSDQKDALPYIFQFVSIEFPNYLTKSTNKIFFSGRALKETGGHSACIDL